MNKAVLNNVNHVIMYERTTNVMRNQDTPPTRATTYKGDNNDDNNNKNKQKTSKTNNILTRR